MQSIPAECVGGPWDGRFIVVTQHTIQIQWCPARLLQDYLKAADPNQPVVPIPYYAGHYRIRIPVTPNSYGNYPYDWQGWQN